MKQTGQTEEDVNGACGHAAVYVFSDPPVDKERL
jgi:hypothetical protein